MRKITPRRKVKTKLFIVIAIVMLIAICLVGIIRLANDFFDKNYFAFNTPINMKFLSPIEIKQRKPQIIEKKLILEYPEEIDTPIEKYICDKWGVYECKTALAVSKAENGTRQPDRFNVNTNGTIDVGIFQINSMHFKKEGCSLAEIVIAERNVDCAYQIWKVQRWSPWVAFKNGNYLGMLEE